MPDDFCRESQTPLTETISSADNTSEVPYQQGQVEDKLEILRNKLKEQVPETPQFIFPETMIEAKESIVQAANDEAINILGQAKLAVINAYSKNEAERTKRQARLLFFIAGFTGLQLVAFNVIFAMIAGWSFKNGNLDILTLLFDLLKYYIGATIVELIGMIWFITKGTFSSDHIKIMELMLKDEPEKNDKKDSEQA